MKIKLILILSLTLLFNISYAKRTAMLVGIQNYDVFAPLENCHGDVDDMKELLKQARFEDDHIWALKDAAYGEFITASKLYSNVNAFARGINEGDEVIFFFSGHGIGGNDGNNYLLGSDGNIDNPEKYGSVSVEEIKRIIKEKKPAEVILIVDACRNFIKKEGKGIGQAVSSKMNISKGIQVKPVIGTKESKQTGKTIVKTIFAASEGQQSYERKDKNNGAFTYYMTYLLDSPNSAMDIDTSKDGIITIEDLILFTDNRINDWTRSQDLPAMNPVYQTEGGVTYEPFMLFRYNAEQVIQEQKKEGSKPIFQYDEKAELEKIKKFTENKEYLKEELPVYQPKTSKDQQIQVDNTDLSSWELALANEKEMEKAKEKEKLFNDLKNKYNEAISQLDKTEDIFVKHEKLEKLRNEINNVEYTDIKQKILPLLEPVYQRISEEKGKKQTEVDKLRPQFEKDICDMEKMVGSSLSSETKQKYLDEFRKKWQDYAKVQKDEDLGYRFSTIGVNKKICCKTTDIELLAVIGGTFLMGGTEPDDKPAHNVTLSGYYISKYEITQGQYQTVMGSNPSRTKSENNPVENITWFEAIEFCNKLSENEGLNKCYTGDGLKKNCDIKANGYRLPTEAEWEYAARGGHLSKGYKFSGSNDANEVAQFGGDKRSTSKPVGGKKPNEIGIYDMSGNVWEWCNDWFGKYLSGDLVDPTGDYSGTNKVARGGSFDSAAEYCLPGLRKHRAPSKSNDSNGFRIVRRAE